MENIEWFKPDLKRIKRPIMLFLLSLTLFFSLGRYNNNKKTFRVLCVGNGNDAIGKIHSQIVNHNTAHAHIENFMMNKTN